MSMNKQGRQTQPHEGGASDPHPTTTGNRALMLEEPLIFEIGDSERTGVDWPADCWGESRLGDLARLERIDLPGLSEPETIRIIPGSAAKITGSTSACSRSAAAP